MDERAGECSGPPRYPFGPLAAAMGMSENSAAILLGASGSTQQEYRNRGMTERVAERLACRAGFHPFEIWPAMADDEIAGYTRGCATEGCPNTFIPIYRGGYPQRYCSPACRGRDNMRRRRQQPEAAEQNRRYSREYKKLLRERRMARTPERVCAVDGCGETFLLTKRNRLYCGPECQAKAAWERRKERVA